MKKIRIGSPEPAGGADEKETTAVEPPQWSLYDGKEIWTTLKNFRKQSVIIYGAETCTVAKTPGIKRLFV